MVLEVITDVCVTYVVETYAKALERVRRAEDTSNVDTDIEETQRRIIKKPSKFRNFQTEDADGKYDIKTVVSRENIYKWYTQLIVEHASKLFKFTLIVFIYNMLLIF